MRPHKKFKISRLNLTALIFLLACAAFPVSDNWGFSDEDCIECHSQANYKSTKQINIEGFLPSVHGKELSCSDCHNKVTEEKHMQVKGSGTVDCRACHEKVGLHGNNVSVACYTCHTRHDIYEASDERSSLNCKNLVTTCGQCHSEQIEKPGDLYQLSAFQIASHRKQDFSIQYSKKMCIGCHQGAAAHGEELPINDQNCYKCHLDIGEHKGILGSIHTPLSYNFTAGAYIGVPMFVVFFLLILQRRKPFHPQNYVKKKKETWPTLPPL